MASSTVELKKILKKAIFAPRSILYFGPKSPDQVENLIRKSFLGKAPETTSNDNTPDRSIDPQKNQVYFLHKEMAQAQVRLEFSSGLLDENLTPSVQLFNEYFGGGMAGLVFQELREARALAYSAWARFFTPSRPNEENILVGSIGCQADKTIDAVHAFIDLLKKMPISETRWSSAQTSLLSTYRTNPIHSRAIPGFVYDVNALGLDLDPRKSRYKALQNSKIENFTDFYQEKVQSRPILFSIVGDSNRININDLAKLGKVTEIKPEQLFRR